MSKLIGMGGSVTVSSTSYPVTEWSANFTNEVQDVTDTGSGGWVARLASVNSCEATFTVYWGAVSGNLASAFAVGNTVAASLVIGASSQSVSGNFIISSFTIKNAAKEAVTFECTAQSTGAVTIA